MRAHPVAGLALCALLACHGRPDHPPLAPRAAAPALVRLRAGTVFAPAIARGETKTYLLDLAAGTFADLVVDQRGIDVAVTVKGPDGRLLASSDSSFGAWGGEPVPVIAERSGQYRLEVQHIATATLEPGGKYEVRLAALRPATPRDRDRV
ncbi:MAG TPA: hypothetical protein VGM86_33270, partial [Thermoanaerobaculia bacterium]